MKQSGYIKAYYNDEEKLIAGLKVLKKENAEILDVLTPFPVHGIDKLLGYRRSRISRAGFVGGAIGAACGFGFQAWVFVKDYPLNIGGKPFLAIPSFIPVTFEMTILFAACAIVFAFLIRSGIGPGAKPLIHDEKITDDRFVVIVGLGKVRSEKHVELVNDMLRETGAQSIVLRSDIELSKNY